MYIPQINNKFTKLIPQKYIFFQFRYKFFEELNWKINEFKIFINFLKQRYDNVLFCSDIEKNLKSNFYNNYFENNYDIIANELINADNDVEIRGIYADDKQQQIEYKNLVNLNDDELE